MGTILYNTVVLAASTLRRLRLKCTPGYAAGSAEGPGHAIPNGKVSMEYVRLPQMHSLVDQPKRRWWSRRRYYLNGHVLYVRGLGPSLEQSYRTSFLKGLARSISVFGLVVLLAIINIAWDYEAESVARAGTSPDFTLRLLPGSIWDWWWLSSIYLGASAC
jgi:hypothetical protein